MAIIPGAIQSLEAQWYMNETLSGLVFIMQFSIPEKKAMHRQDLIWPHNSLQDRTEAEVFR